MLIPELPSHLIKMGGQAYVGYIIALFTLMAGLARPFSGRLSDTIGRVPVMVLGSLACFVCGLCYPFFHTVTVFLLLRFVHGLSTGTKPTGTSAYVADIISAEHRGAATGLLSIFTAIGMSIGPALGSLIVSWSSLNVLFYTSSALALGSILILWDLPETLPNKQRFRWSLLRIGWQDVYEPRVSGPFWAMLLLAFPAGVLLTMAPIQSELLAVGSNGMFFMIYTLAALFIRLVASKVSDTWGRVPVLFWSSGMLAISCALIAVASNAWLFLTSAVIYGFASGLLGPTLIAWTIDLSDENFRGRALATMFIALEIGIGLGAWLSGFLYQGQTEHIWMGYGISTVLVSIAMIYLQYWKRTNRAVVTAV